MNIANGYLCEAESIQTLPIRMVLSSRTENTPAPDEFWSAKGRFVKHHVSRSIRTMTDDGRTQTRNRGRRCIAEEEKTHNVRHICVEWACFGLDYGCVHMCARAKGGANGKMWKMMKTHTHTHIISFRFAFSLVLFFLLRCGRYRVHLQYSLTRMNSDLPYAYIQSYRLVSLWCK